MRVPNVASRIGRCRVLLLFALFIGTTGCATRHAQLYVRTVDVEAANTPLGDCRILAAADGTVIGTSLTPIPLQKSPFARAPVLAILVERDGYAPVWTMFRINRWASTAVDAADAANRTEVHVELRRCP